MSDPLLVERPANGVAVVTLNRPEKRNALSLALRERLRDTFAELAGDDGVRCAVLTGAGSAFCAGMDRSEFGGDRAHRERLVELSIAAFGAVATFPKPLVAALNGPAVAGGFALALWCDLRIASTGAWMGFPEAGQGIPPSYAAARAAVSAALAAELCLTRRSLDADEALARGVVSEVVAPARLAARGLAVATDVAALPLLSSATTKHRILLERETVWGALRADEERALRDALLAQP